MMCKVNLSRLYKGNHVCMEQWRATRFSRLSIYKLLKVAQNHKLQHVTLSLVVLYMHYSKFGLS
jgi:hypothetical protein